MIEALIQAQYRLPSDFDTIMSITRVNDDEALIISTFGVWKVRRNINYTAGFEVKLLVQRKIKD